ncbi:MAG: hypothetical protein A4E56_02245 [Pelotomaculum sp. PtaU1.Bin065]|nr:MAG: hypothetical protein A4E56_02245 [Pelotomaculum sp. PtaU1.Bin065]
MKKSSCGRDCDTCRFLMDFCPGCSEDCGASACKDRQCMRCDYLCPGRPGAIAFLNSLGGPEFPTLKGQKVKWPGQVPQLLPAVATRFTEMPAPGQLPWVAMNAARMVISRAYEAGGLRRDKGNMRGFARVHKDTKIVLHMYIPDPPLEAFWRTREKFYPALREFDLVIAPNFSVYTDSPMLEHLINMKRSILVYSEMLAAGVKAILDVSWGAYTDLDRWSNFIQENNIPVVSTSIQTVGQNAGNSWREYLKGVCYLCRQISEKTIIILCGAGTAEKMWQIKSELKQQVVFLTTQPFLLARKGRMIDRRLAPGARDYDRLFLENTQALCEQLE